jgi:hypothetical protein
VRVHHTLNRRPYGRSVIEISDMAILDLAVCYKQHLVTFKWWCNPEVLFSTQSSRHLLLYLIFSRMGTAVIANGTAKSDLYRHEVTTENILELPVCLDVHRPVFQRTRDMTPCSPVEVDRRFGEIYWLDLQGRKIKASDWLARNMQLWAPLQTHSVSEQVQFL